MREIWIFWLKCHTRYSDQYLESLSDEELENLYEQQAENK